MTVCGIKHADGVCVMGKCPYIKMCCPTVWDKSGEPMTNEEWIKSLDTEQLAKWLARITNAGYLLALRMKYHCDDVDAVREWLKEKHD